MQDSNGCCGTGLRNCTPSRGPVHPEASRPRHFLTSSLRPRHLRPGAWRPLHCVVALRPVPPAPPPISSGSSARLAGACEPAPAPHQPQAAPAHSWHAARSAGTGWHNLGGEGPSGRTGERSRRAAPRPPSPSSASAGTTRHSPFTPPHSCPRDGLRWPLSSMLPQPLSCTPLHPPNPSPRSTAARGMKLRPVSTPQPPSPSSTGVPAIP